MTCPRCNGPANEETLREFGGVCPKCLLNFSKEQDAPAFPNLEIIEMIGQGGMGVVYKARQKNLDRLVALKVLSPHLSEDPEFVERFTREAKALAQLSHPNIVAIHDSGIHDRVPYLVMEFIDGAPLRSALASGKLTPSRALEVIPQICDALQYAHSHGVVHRDIKPENILIDRQGRVKIADFGLAKLSADQSKITMSGYVLGTPRYMAPEQFEPSGRVDHRADIYSLGVVFYEMLTGEVPMGRFKPPSAKADVDRRLDPVVLKSLEREPDDRYQSAGEVKQEVTGLHNRPAVPGRTGTRPVLKGCLIVLVVLVALVILFLLAMVPHSAKSSARSAAPLPPRVVVTAPELDDRKPANPRYQRNAVPEFKIDDVWPAATDLPAGLEGSKFLEGAEVLKRADLPEAILPDLDSTRGLLFQYGKAIMVGLQFKTEFARRRWQREEAWKKEMDYWHYSLFGDGQAMLLLRHDRSAPGAAAAEILQALVEKKYIAKYPQTRK